MPKKNISKVAQPKAQVYLMDRPGSLQSIIFAVIWRLRKPTRMKSRLEPPTIFSAGPLPRASI